MTIGLRSNPLLRELISAAVSLRAGLLADDALEWEEEYESRVFSRDVALVELEKLHYANLSSRRFDLQDYHGMLLYFALQDWIDSHNSTVQDTGRPRRIGPFEVSVIDLEGVFDQVFWDDDFLLPEGIVNAPHVKEAMRLTDDAWSIANQLPPHPSELTLKERGDTCEWDDRIHHYVAGQDYPSDCRAPEDAKDCVEECFWTFDQHNENPDTE